MPFADLAGDHAREILAARGSDAATEAEIAAAAAALLDRAERGPDSTAPGTAAKRTWRVAGRTKATNNPAWPRPDDEPVP